MDGIRNLTGAREETVEIGGRQYTLAVKLMGAWGEREKYILGLKEDPFAIARRVAEEGAISVQIRLDSLAEKMKTYEEAIQGKDQEGDETQREEAAAIQAVMAPIAKDLGEIKAAVARLQVSVQIANEAAWKRASAPRVVSLEEDAQFDNSVHGTGYRFLCALQKYHGDEFKTVQDALDLMEQVSSQDGLRILKDKLDKVEEADILGN